MLLALGFFSSALCAAVEITPTTRVNQSLNFVDDLNLQLLDRAIDRQLEAYERGRILTGQIRFGTKVYPKSVLKDSLLLLKKLAATYESCIKTKQPAVCKSQFNLSMNQQFAIYKPVPRKNEAGYQSKLTTKFTSYYSPDFHGSRTPSDRFSRPIYRWPDNEADQKFSRVEIDFKGALANKGLEIFWVEESFFELYLLHVQGGGRITVNNPDGTQEVKYLSYEAKNSLPFKMIYHYLVAQGYLKPEEATVENQRRFLQQNPDKEEEVFNSCPSYVFFKESSEEPVGLDSIPLTEGRSLALDSRIYKTTGLINFVSTSRATDVDEAGQVIKTPFSRFFIAQDTGGAIRGSARCDLYFGYGPEAERVAYSMNDMGEQYFLIKK